MRRTGQGFLPRMGAEKGFCHGFPQMGADGFFIRVILGELVGLECQAR